MFAKICVFYAFGFFFAILALVSSIILKLNNDSFKDLIFLVFFGLLFSFPGAMAVLFLKANKIHLSKKIKKFRNRFSTGKELRRFFLGISFCLLLILVGGSQKKKLGFWFGKKAFFAKPTPIVPKDSIDRVIPALTATSEPLRDEEPADLNFEKLDFDIDGKLIFLRLQKYEKKEMEPIMMVTWDGKQKGVYGFLYNQSTNRWQPDRDYPTLFLEFGRVTAWPLEFLYSYRYFPRSQEIELIWNQGGYKEQCWEMNEKRLCFRGRSTYFGPKKYWTKPWDGRFFYLYPDGGEEEVGNFSYDDLKIAWPKQSEYDYCDVDCFSAGVLGWFDHSTKALLKLGSESTSGWNAPDGSGWFGFYLYDLTRKKLTPFVQTDFGPGGTAQRFDVQLPVIKESLVYLRNRNGKTQLVTQDLVTRQKKVLRQYSRQLGFYESDFYKIEPHYLGVEFRDKEVWEYFDLKKQTQVDPLEVPAYIANKDGYWNQAGSQYVWRTQEGAIYIFDKQTGKTALLRSYSPREHLSTFSLVAFE
ncbi:hypothetical protein ACFLZP_01720 [Patescibacteria group bacterium]